MQLSENHPDEEKTTRTAPKQSATGRWISLHRNAVADAFENPQFKGVPQSIIDNVDQPRCWHPTDSALVRQKEHP